MSAGLNLRKAVKEEVPLQVAGAINAYCARLAERAGFKGLYLSGAGTANASFGLPDLGITSLNDVCEDVSRITATTQVPLLVDADTGWGGAFNIARTVRDLTRAGAAGCHLEDQEQAKRCGHRPNKALVSSGEMVNRIKAAVDARTDDQFVVMARTDAVASEGVKAGIDRAVAYVEAGADMIFAEALYSLEDYRAFTGAGTGPGEYHRVWKDAAVHGRRTQRGWSSSCSVPFERISRDECGGGARLRNDTQDRESKRRHRTDANARAAVRRSELSLLRRQVGSIIYQKSGSLNYERR
jgi:hypothetical protein